MKKAVNLLPPAEQHELRTAATYAQVVSFGGWLVVSLLVLSLFLFLGRIFLEIETQTVSEQVAAEREGLEKYNVKEFRAEVVAFNKNLSNFQALVEENHNWSQVFLEIGRILPSQVTLDGIMIDGADLKVELNGRAASREAALQLRQNLLQSEFFQRVNFPLDNLENSADLEWSYRFYIRPQALVQ